MDFFKIEVPVLLPVFDAEQEKDVWKPQKKTLTFKELNQKDKTQHKLHFLLIGLMEEKTKDADTNQDGKIQMVLDTDKLYEITVKSVKVLSVLNEEFTLQDQKCLLDDSGALFQLGMVLMKDHLGPFFLTLSGISNT